MAIIKAVELTLNALGFTKGAKEVESSVDSLNETFKEQQRILIDFEKELAVINRKLAEIPKNNLPGIKALKDRQSQLTTAIKEQRVDLKGLSADLKDSKEAYKENEKGVEALDNAFGGATSGVKKLASSLKALWANPYALLIGAVVGAVVGLYKAFERTAEGSDFLEIKLGGLMAALSPVLDSFGKLSRGIIALFSGELEEAEYLFRTAFLNLGDNMREAYEQNEELVKAQRELNQVTRDAALEASKLNKEIKQQAAITEDSTRSIEERLAANEKQKVLAQELVDSESRLLDKKMEIADLEKKLAGDSDKEKEAALNKENALLVEYEELQERKALVDRRYYDTYERLLNDKLAREKEYLDNRNIMLDEARSIEIGIDKNFEAARKDIAQNLEGVDNKYFSNLIKNIDKEKAARWQIFGAVQSIFMSTERLTQRNIKAQKSFAIASALLSTFQAAAQSLADWKSFNPVQKIAGMATVLAVGLAQVASIKRVNTSIGATSVGSTSLGNFSQAQQQQGSPQFNLVGQSGTNQIIDALKANPIKTYVLGKDVTSQQELDRNILSSASL